MIQKFPQVNDQNQFVHYLVEGVGEMINTEIGFPDFLQKETNPIYFDDHAVMIKHLVDLFGTRGAKGISYRAGECAFLKFLSQFGEAYQLNDGNYRLKNPSGRIFYGLNQLAAFISNQTNTEILIEDTHVQWIWKMSMLDGQQGVNEIWESYLLGWIRGFLSWSSSGRFFVLEVLPSLQIDNFVIGIYKLPLGN